MTAQMPPGQLTTSELSREIAVLELALRSWPADGHRQQKGRLTALYAERDERKRLAEHRPKTPTIPQFPDGAS
jgi:hypothetical protein